MQYYNSFVIDFTKVPMSPEDREVGWDASLSTKTLPEQLGSDELISSATVSVLTGTLLTRILEYDVTTALLPTALYLHWLNPPVTNHSY